MSFVAEKEIKHKKEGDYYLVDENSYKYFQELKAQEDYDMGLIAINSLKSGLLGEKKSNDLISNIKQLG